MAGIKDIARGAGVRKEDVVDVFEEILRLVKRGETAKIVGFGSFQKKSFPGRTITSSVINDGEPTQFGKSLRIAFKQSEGAKKRMNKKRKSKATKTTKKKTKKKAAKK